MSDEQRQRRSPFLTREQHDVAELAAQLIAEELDRLLRMPLAHLTNKIDRLVELAERAGTEER